MTMGNLPPQAYTKDTVAKAYEWLQGQADDVKALASNMDQLVAMYLRAKRGGFGFDAPVSSQKFRSDLKELATELNQFESGFQDGPKPPQATSPQNSGPEKAPTVDPSKVSRESAPPPRDFTFSGAFPDPPPSPVAQAPSAQPAMRPAAPAPPNTTKKETLSRRSEGTFDPGRLDSRSQAAISDVKTRLNLGSDQEALRLLISLGYEKAKAILPPIE